MLAGHVVRGREARGDRGRLSAQALPAESLTRYVRFDRPPATSEKSERRLLPTPRSASNHSVDAGRHIRLPSTRCSAGSALRMVTCEASAHRVALTTPAPKGRQPSRARPGIVARVAIDVTDAEFEQSVLDRSEQVPVVVDLWAPWCGPCRTLGPILEDVIDATGGAVELAKVNVDENPRISAAFQVQSIPAVMAIKDRKVVDGFIGAVPTCRGRGIRRAACRLRPPRPTARGGRRRGLAAAQALELQPDHSGAVVALARSR